MYETMNLKKSHVVFLNFIHRNLTHLIQTSKMKIKNMKVKLNL